MAKERETLTGREVLVEAILEMRYGDLIAVSETLCQMKRARLETREDFAELLYEFAQQQHQ